MRIAVLSVLMALGGSAVDRRSSLADTLLRPTTRLQAETLGFSRRAKTRNTNPRPTRRVQRGLAPTSGLNVPHGTRTPLALESAGTRDKKELTVGLIQCRTSSKDCGLPRGVRTARKNAFQAFLHVLRTHPEVDVLLAPEWFLVKSQGIYSKQEMKQMRVALERETQGRSVLAIPGTTAWSDGKRYRNTAMVVGNGKTLLQYNKQNPTASRIYDSDRDFLKQFNIQGIIGKKPGTFAWGGLKVGLEICADHAVNSLAQRTAKTGQRLDLQLVVSCGLHLKPEMYPESVAVHDKGSMVLCDGLFQDSRALKFLGAPPAATDCRISRKTATGFSGISLMTVKIPIDRQEE